MNTATATATAPATLASLKAKAERAEFRYDELANELDEAQYEAECARNECDEFAEGGRLTEWERELLSDMKREARRLETVARRLAVKLTNAEQAWCKALEALGTAEGEAIIAEAQAQAEAQEEATRAEVENLEREIEATRHTLREFDRLGEEAFNRYRNTGERAHKDAVLDYIERSANTRDELDALVSRLVELTK